MPVEPVRTERLLLVPATAALVAMEIADLPGLAAALDAEIPPDWPTDALREALPLFERTLREHPAHVGWLPWYWLATAEGRRVLVGSGGCKGPPDADGVVEMGYGVQPAFQGRGYATEAVARLIRWVRGQPGVRRVVAECLPTNLASLRVLSRCGFRHVGDGLEAGHDRFEYMPASGEA